MILVTGAAGFIGSNLIAFLNEHGITDIVACDYLKDGHKLMKLAPLKVREIVSPDDGIAWANNAECVIHLGACTDTMEWDGEKMLSENYVYSRRLRQMTRYGARFIYASSAAVYGKSNNFSESNQVLVPLNVYGLSKLMQEREMSAQDQCAVGLRFFNVYGSGEEHKGRMTSMVSQMVQTANSGRPITLFHGTHKRDFVHVRDVCRVIHWFMWNEKGGIYNVGSGESVDFYEIGDKLSGKHDVPVIRIPMPDTLKPNYQSYTCADMAKLRNAGYTEEFASVLDYV